MSQDVLIRQLQALFADRFNSLGIRAGSHTCSFSASSTSALGTVGHQLGRVPLFIAVVAKKPIVVRAVFGTSDTDPDATNFYFRGYTTDSSSVTLVQDVYWVVVG